MVSNIVYTAAIGVILLAGCDRNPYSGPPGQQSPLALRYEAGLAEAERQAAESARQMKIVEEQVDRYDQLLQKWERQEERISQLIDRWETTLERVNRILDGVETAHTSDK